MQRMKKNFHRNTNFLFLIIIAFIFGCDNKFEKIKSKKQEIKLKDESFNVMISKTQIWRDFLNCWNTEIRIKRKENNDVFLNKNSWLKENDLSEKEFLLLKEHIKIDIPQSYKDFLMVTNGSINLNYQGSDDKEFAFHSFDKIDLFSKLSKKTYEIWTASYLGVEISDEDYSVYGKNQIKPKFRPKYLETAIEIGTFHLGSSEYILINPQVKKRNGEYEILWLSPKFPGMRRYESFVDLMISLYYEDIHDDAYPNDSQIKMSCAKYIFNEY
jgi:hypothetical protein